MKINILLIVSMFFTGLTFANDLSKTFAKGKGSSYKLNLGDSNANLSIYVADSSAKTVNIEYFMESKESLLPVQLWQQFAIEASSGNKTQVKQGWVQSKEMKAPEIMTSEYLQGADGVQVNDFLFNDKAELDKNKIADEEITIAAGKTKTTHYRQKNNDQTIDYWISDEAKPIGLVKLVSSHPKESKHNYKLELVSLMTNVKAYINPKVAVPLSKDGKSFLVKPSIR